MALNIDKKVYRNLQEQVSWLTTTVGEIIDITDPVAIKEAIDKIDTFEDEMAGYALTMQGYATTMGGYATTMQGYSNTMAGYALTMQGYASQVDTWTNNISAAAVSAIAGATIAPANVNASGAITGDSIIENMSGYAFVNSGATGLTISYAGVVKNGNKITYAIAGSYIKQAGVANVLLGSFNNPQSIYNKLYPNPTTAAIDNKIVGFIRGTVNIVNCYATTQKTSSGLGQISTTVYGIGSLTDGVTYDFRYEVTFLLSDNLAA